MKRFLILCLIFFLAVLPACQKVAPLPTGDAPLGDYNYDLSEYLTAGDWRGVRAEFAPVGVCTEEEIDRAVHQILLASATFSPKEGTAARFDQVTLTVTREKEGEEAVTEEDVALVIGLEANDHLSQAVGEACIGKGAGESFSLAYTYPEEESYLALAGEEVTLRVTVKKLEAPTLPELNDETVKSLKLAGITTVAAFRDQVKEELLEFKLARRREAVWLEYLKTVTVLQYPEKELQENLDSYRNYCVELAAAMELDFHDFLAEYMGCTPEEFERDALEDAKTLVKNDMVMEYLARTMEIGLSEEEYQAGLKTYYEGQSEDFDSAEEFEEYYGKEYIRQHLTWDKAVDRMAESAVRIGASDEAA